MDKDSNASAKTPHAKSNLTEVIENMDIRSHGGANRLFPGLEGVQEEVDDASTVAVGDSPIEAREEPLEEVASKEVLEEVVAPAQGPVDRAALMAAIAKAQYRKILLADIRQAAFLKETRQAIKREESAALKDEVPVVSEASAEDDVQSTTRLNDTYIRGIIDALLTTFYHGLYERALKGHWSEKTDDMDRQERVKITKRLYSVLTNTADAQLPIYLSLEDLKKNLVPNLLKTALAANAESSEADRCEQIKKWVGKFRKILHEVWLYKWNGVGPLVSPLPEDEAVDVEQLEVFLVKGTFLQFFKGVEHSFEKTLKELDKQAAEIEDGLLIHEDLLTSRDDPLKSLYRQYSFSMMKFPTM